MMIFIAWIVFIFFKTKKTNLIRIKNYKYKNFCNAKIEGPKILEFNQCEKSDKTPFIIYADLESLIEKMEKCKKNPEKSSTTKVGEHIHLSFSMSTISSFTDKK